ncbi:unnamed protein product [Rhizoctonia solani]|uniref:Zn(2)-C6 fungal-type domain-containing protein n=1 Tax=Rhizoctonia solani TaxID=456999 RepID=A0A8H3AV97_9AGAM|nr:unnamed protein product [Rhizoctonia solani]
MPQSEAGPSRQRRQYVARACGSCRRRRCRCDGSQPVCMACLSSGYECTWGTEQVSDRPAAKQFVESLRVKIQLLESEIARFKREQFETLRAPSYSSSALPHSIPEPAESLGGIFNTLPTFGSGKELSDVFTKPSCALPELPRSIQTNQSAPVKTPIINLPSITTTFKYQYIFNIDTSLPLDEQYPLHRASLLCQWDRHMPDLSPAKLSRLEHDTILSRCFTHGASFSFGILPDLFLAELLECLAPESVHPRSLVDSRYYTPTLHCSLMAFASGFSDSPEIRAKATRAKFATHAKRWLDLEFNQPSSSLALSLALLSEYHSGMRERTIGNMYMGMAVRAMQAPKPALIGQELGRTPTSYPPYRAYPTLILGWHHWSAFIQECLMALEGNGPSDLQLPKSSISCPIALEADSRPPLTESITGLLTHSDYFKYSARCFIQMGGLMVIATRMIKQPINDKQTLLDIHLQLETWFNALPEGVLIRQRATLTFPPVLALHITYWWLILHLNFFSVEKISTEELKDLSTKMRARATEKLIQLLNTFDKQFGWRYFPRNLTKAIYTCGLALVKERDSATSASRKKRATAIEGIEICINSLKVIGEAWPGVVYMSEDLGNLAGHVE